MYQQVEKPKENKSSAVTNSIAQKKSNGKQNFGFVNNQAKAKQTNPSLTLKEFGSFQSNNL
jgi:hypothetical protein